MDLREVLMECKSKSLDKAIIRILNTFNSAGFGVWELLLSLSRYFYQQGASPKLVRLLEEAAQEARDQF